MLHSRGEITRLAQLVEQQRVRIRTSTAVSCLHYILVIEAIRIQVKLGRVRHQRAVHRCREALNIHKRVLTRVYRCNLKIRSPAESAWGEAAQPKGSPNRRPHYSTFRVAVVHYYCLLTVHAWYGYVLGYLVCGVVFVDLFTLPPAVRELRLAFRRSVLLYIYINSPIILPVQATPAPESGFPCCKWSISVFSRTHSLVFV